MTRPSNSQPSSQELLERGRLTLQAIEFHERAARYKAAAASLKAAMVQAENGQFENLHRWLELESHRFNGGIFNAGILGCGTVFIQSLFNGNIFYSFLGIMVPLIIVEYYRVKEKFYWKEMRSKK